MKLIILLLTAGVLQVSASTYGQNVTLKKKSATLVSIFKEIRKQTGYDFVYSDRMLEKASLVDLDLNNVPILDALKKAFENQPFVYQVDKSLIVLKAMPVVNQQRIITGKVMDEDDHVLIGVSVKSQKTNTITKTDKNGKYAINVVDNTDVLTFTCIGYEPKVIPVSNKGVINVQLKSKVDKLDDVIITGTGIERKVNSFTGAAATYSGAELKTVGNNNLISSLRALDPSFIQIENNLKGSNPNVLPNLEVRGKTTVTELSLKDQFGTDPNQPLFILDGFESNLQTIIDLDINRVASVVILKDAASTALYGSKAANGVIVVETVKPVPGKLRFSFNNDIRIEGPDLSVYNLMNSSEKLEFERLSGRYKIDEPTQQLMLDSIYYANKAAIARGVDTYWLAEPVRNIISQNNSISASGGDEVIRYGLNFNYKSNPGVMKGSFRNSWGGSINLIYRKSKVNISNTFTVGGQESSESRYGNFTNFAYANPYYEKGTDNPYLDQTKTFSTTITTRGLNIANPLYNASLPFKNGSNGLTITNNLSIQYDIMPKFRLNGGLSVSKGMVQTDVFVSPDHTTQASFAPTLRGKYTDSKSQNFSYSTNALLTYGNVFNEKHAVTLNLRGQMNHNYSISRTSVAQGFPTGTDPILRFAYGYETAGRPNSNSASFRGVNFTGSANYSYDMKYLFDASYRLDGSTSFGKNDPWSPYWSTGIGWNAHQESFLKNQKIFSRIKFYSNIGVTGNQAMGMPVSTSIYQYLNAYNKVGMGIDLLSLGNSAITPSKTTQLSSGFDFGLFGDRVTGSVNIYSKVTNNQIIDVAYPTSSGVSSYQYNAGKLATEGYEARLTVLVWNNVAKRILWRVGLTGASSDGKYEGFGNALDKLNKKMMDSKSLRRFQDGASPNDMYTVRSLGIDPGTGREMFIAEDGSHTLDYDAADMPKVGSSKPLVEGVLSNQFTYKNASFSFFFRYKAKEDIFNQALLNKVENIDYNSIVNNQDKRALYERWKKPGDIARFKSISMTDKTQMSTRFLQEENTLSFESINMSYMFTNLKWVRKMGMQSLTLSGYANDIFRMSTVKRERGIEYPFARSISFSLRASF